MTLHPLLNGSFKWGKYITSETSFLWKGKLIWVAWILRYGYMIFKSGLVLTTDHCHGSSTHCSNCFLATHHQFTDTLDIKYTGRFWELLVHLKRGSSKRGKHENSTAAVAILLLICCQNQVSWPPIMVFNSREKVHRPWNYFLFHLSSCEVIPQNIEGGDLLNNPLKSTLKYWKSSVKQF